MNETFFPQNQELISGQLLLMNKPLGWTSFDMVGYIRRLLREYRSFPKIKIGHAGTLDPLATGLLLVCTGKHTKRVIEFTEMEKEYTGQFILGATRPSFDKETEIDQTYPTDHLTAEQIFHAASHFTGEQKQTPPAFSATKVQGIPAYLYARDNQQVVIEPKKITIHQFEITSVQLPEVAFRIVCSKGTYIRALARDFGQHLACGAYLDSLCRTRIGPYLLENATEPGELLSLLRKEKQIPG
ncbi:MAG TPA: tRNA pseudouridine(55) synthase TruB [Bacteroidales bacterium]|nr:tRNA pseudouridine(55) synthase TruB [Bacteroidales bacterium]